MNRKPRPSIQFENLEGRQLLSTAYATIKHPAAQVAAPTRGITLDGSLKMPVSSIATFVQNGQNVGTFRLNGRLGSLGPVKGVFVALLDTNNQYMSSGELVLSNRRGTVSLAMTSDPSDIKSYLYKVDSGTGAFASLSGTGKLTTAGVTPNGSVMTFNLRST